MKKKMRGTGPGGRRKKRSESAAKKEACRETHHNGCSQTKTRSAGSGATEKKKN